MHKASARCRIPVPFDLPEGKTTEMAAGLTRSGRCWRSAIASSSSAMRAAAQARGSAAQARGSVVGFESALLKRAKNFSFRGCIRRPRESLLGRGYRPARRATASRRACPSTAGDQGKGAIKGKEGAHSSPLSIYSALWGLRQDPGRAA